MQQLQRLAMFVKIRWDHLRVRIDNWVFDRKLARASKKYGGGANIPPEVVGELLGDVGDDHSFIFAVYLTRVCKRLDIDALTTKVFDRTCWMYNGSIPSIEDKIYALGIIDELSEHPKKYAYAVALRELIANDDTSYNKIREHFNTFEEYELFMMLCGRE